MACRHSRWLHICAMMDSFGSCFGQGWSVPVPRPHALSQARPVRQNQRCKSEWMVLQVRADPGTRKCAFAALLQALPAEAAERPPWAAFIALWDLLLQFPLHIVQAPFVKLVEQLHGERSDFHPGLSNSGYVHMMRALDCRYSSATACSLRHAGAGCASHMRHSRQPGRQSFGVLGSSITTHRCVARSDARNGMAGFICLRMQAEHAVAAGCAVCAAHLHGVLRELGVGH